MRVYKEVTRKQMREIISHLGSRVQYAHMSLSERTEDKGAPPGVEEFVVSCAANLADYFLETDVHPLAALYLWCK